MNFDLDGDWPSPGWTISFGKIVVTGPTQAALFIEGSGLRHKAEFLYDQDHPTDSSLKRHWARTIDGSFILYAYDDKPGTGLVGGYARYPDGRETWFAARNQKGNALYTTKSRDVHGNFISIKYRGDRGPALERVDDTSGRTFTFHYDTRGELITIKGPSLGGTIKPLVKFGYRGELKVACLFKQPISGDRPTIPQLLAYVYLPANGSLYHVQEYDPCGYITGIGQYVGAKYSGGSDVQEGTLDPGTRIRLREYLYDKPANGWTKTPNYHHVRETISQPNGPDIVATTVVAVTTPPNDRDKSLTYTRLPDQSQIYEYTYAQGDLAGMPHVTHIVPAGWENDWIKETRFWYSEVKGDWGLPRPKQIDYSVHYGKGSADGHTITNSLFYQDCAQAMGDHCYNVVKEIRTSTRRLGHAVFSSNNISKERFEYLPYGFRLPTKTELLQCKPGATDQNDPTFDCTDLKRKVVIGYDDYATSPLIAITDAKGHERLSGRARGNATKIERFALHGDDERLFGPQTENRQYDETGNVRKVWGGCCITTDTLFSKATEYTFPEKTVLGKSDDDKLSVSSEATFDMSTGLIVSTRSKAGKQDNKTSVTYDTSDPLNMRITRTLPTGATVVSTIKNSGIVVEESAALSAGSPTTGRTKYEFNGLGLPGRMTLIGAQDGKGEAIETLYDTSGRVEAESLPYSVDQPTKYWTRYAYDALGRLTTVTDANNHSTRFHFNRDYSLGFFVCRSV